MNKRLILYILGWVLICEGAAMQICTVTSIIFRENEGLYFLITGAVCALLGVLAVKVKKPKNMVLYQKAGAELDPAFLCGRASVFPQRRDSELC